MCALINKETQQKNVEFNYIDCTLPTFYKKLENQLDENYLNMFVIGFIENLINEIKLNDIDLFHSIEELFEMNKIDMNQTNDMYYFFLAVYYYYMEETLRYITKNAIIYNYLQMAMYKENYYAIIFYAIVFQSDEPNKQDSLIHPLLEKISNDDKGYIIYQLGNYYYNFDKERGLFYYNYIVENKFESLSLFMGVHFQSLATLFYKEKQYENMKYCYVKAIEKSDLESAALLGCFYNEQQDYVNMKKYLILLVDCFDGDVDSLNKFGFWNHIYPRLVHGDALLLLGKYYQNIEKNYDEMKRCYDIIEKKFKKNEELYSEMLFQYGKYYQYVEKDYKKMIDCYLKSEGYGNKDAMKQLGEFYINKAIEKEREENDEYQGNGEIVERRETNRSKQNYHYLYLLFINLFLIFNVLFKCLKLV